jgi:hypothetical protein
MEAKEIAHLSSKIRRLTVKGGTGYSDRSLKKSLLKKNL